MLRLLLCSVVSRSIRSIFSFALACLLASGVVWAQQGSMTTPAGSPDPLALGKAAMQKRDFVTAHKFFADFLVQKPGDVEATFYLASSDLELKNFAEAASECRAVIAAKPNEWGAHDGLVFALAQLGQWAAFDQERAAIAAARVAHAPGIPAHGNSVIDAFTVGDQKYTVRQYDPPEGNFHTKYRFVHFDAEGKVDSWIACESDDIDQTFFAKAHPAEAAAGKRSYSLDSYSARKQMPNGTFTQTHGTMRFYQDGEPTYEQVRADVIAALTKHSGPMSSTTVNK